MITARTLFVLCLLAAGVAGCATQVPSNTETISAAPQLKPGEARARMNGQIGWYGGVSSNAR